MEWPRGDIGDDPERVEPLLVQLYIVHHGAVVLDERLQNGHRVLHRLGLLRVENGRVAVRGCGGGKWTHGGGGSGWWLLTDVREGGQTVTVSLGIEGVGGHQIDVAADELEVAVEIVANPRDVGHQQVQLDAHLFVGIVDTGLVVGERGIGGRRQH